MSAIRLAAPAILGAALTCAACGGGAREALPAPPSQPAPSAPSAAAPAAPAAPSPPSESASAVLSPPPPRLEMKSPLPSTMLADLQALALDPANLPPIERLDPKALRGVMKLIARSLGAKCVDCHRESDFALPTPRKKLAAKMWNEFVAKLAFAADGAPLFCDSCHQGRTKQLDRTDKKALAEWMDANFVQKLKRKDQRDHECETCHVDMDMRFLNKWAGGGF